MIKINLLPWREERRKQRAKTFQFMVAGSVAAGVVLALLGWTYFNIQISGQESRNAYLEQEIKKVEAQIKDIEELEAKRTALLNRKQVIEELQGSRYQMVHLFDSLMRTVPEGLVLTSLKQEGEYLTVEGRAQSNARVATYMRNLAGAGWMKDPQVNVIEAAKSAAAPAAGAAATPFNDVASMLPYIFTMRITLATPETTSAQDAAALPDPVPVQQQVQANPDAAQMVPLTASPGTAPAPAAAHAPAPAAAPQAESAPASAEKF